MIEPREKAHEIMNKCVGICSPSRFDDYNNPEHINRAKEAALYIISEINQAAEDKVYWAQVTWFITSSTYYSIK